MIRQLVMLTTALGSAAPAGAQAVQPWPDISVTVPIAPNWIGSVQVVARIADDARTSQFETRLQLGRVLSQKVTVWAGWIHYHNYIPQARDTAENQALEQVNWTVASIGRIRLLSRTRLEQRFISNIDQTSWRIREQVRGMVALGGTKAPSVVLWAEPFVALNRTGAQHHDLDQLRSFAGINVPISPRANIEIGYLNQRLYRANDRLVNHAIPLMFSYRF